MPRARFTQEDIEDWTRRRWSGESLRSIAEQYGVTTQYVSAVTSRAQPPSADDGPEDEPSTPPEDLDSLAARVNEWLIKQTTVTIPDVRREFRLTSHQWNQIWKKLDNSRIVGKLRDRSRKATYRDVDIRKALRKAYAANGKKPLSSAMYDEVRDSETEPSVPTIHNRYGSWRSACADAKVPCGGSRHHVAKGSPPPTWSVWTDDEILEWVRKFWGTLEQTERPSYNRYDVWQRTQEGAPSGSLVRVRLRHIGSWSDIIAAVASTTAA